MMELNNLTGFLVHRTDVKMTNFFTKKLKQYEVTPEQWGIIMYLTRKEQRARKSLLKPLIEIKPLL